MKKYSFDPDFRKDPDVTRPFCVRCQKPVNPETAIHVTVDWDTWELSEGGDDLLGRCCWKEVKRANVG